MMKQDLFNALEDELAGQVSSEPWLAGLVMEMRSEAASVDSNVDHALIAEAAANARRAPAPALVPTTTRRRTIVSRFRRGLVFNAVVVSFLLFGSAAFAVTATRNGYAPAPIGAVVDRVADWAGFDQISPVELPEITHGGQTLTPVDQNNGAPSGDLPGNRGGAVGPPDNAENGGAVTPGKTEVLPGGENNGNGPPDNSNAGGNQKSNAGGNSGDSNAGRNSENSNAGGSPAGNENSNAGANSDNSNAGGNSGGNDNSNAGGNSENSNAGGNSGNSNAGGNSGR